MKRNQLIYAVAILIMMFFVYSCTKKDDNKVSYSDLDQNVQKIIPEASYNAILDLGMPVNDGTTPPIFENTYLVSPFTLVKTSIVDDYYPIGHVFADMTIKYFNQNTVNNTVEINYINGGETGVGIGGYISGAGQSFTVFAKMRIYHDVDSADIAMITSGKLTSVGISDFYYANFMLNNYGNPSGYFIGNNTGRLIYDSDGTSEITSDLVLKSAKTAGTSANQK